MKPITRDNISELKAGDEIVSYYDLSFSHRLTFIAVHPKDKEKFVFDDMLTDELMMLTLGDLTTDTVYDEPMYYFNEGNYMEQTELHVKLMEKHLEFLHKRVDSYKKYDEYCQRSVENPA